ncbi:MAG: hypothetical protein NVS2B14_12570 [Chamaesiphon sp.]
MAERPIKRSERQIVAESNDVVETNTDAKSPEERETTKPLPRKNTEPSRKDRGHQQKEEASRTSPLNLALVRGPKPKKEKPPVIHTPQELTDSDEPELIEQQEETE